jgi:hypothetical protein
MNIKYYEKKGFVPHCTMVPSTKYTQGIDIVYDDQITNETKAKDFQGMPAVYVMSNAAGKVLKIGQTFDVRDRFYSQYKSTVNATNDRIRVHIREEEPIRVHIFTMPKFESEVLGYNVKTSYATGLEEALLREFKKANDELPGLNTMIK